MAYEIIRPLGPREGPGTFDCIFNTQKYPTIKEAEAANDFVKIDFVRDDSNTIFFEFSYSKAPDEKSHERLQIQHFPAGIDVFDDNTAVSKAIEILKSKDND
jgi:hypothetical protein